MELAAQITAIVGTVTLLATMVAGVKWALFMRDSPFPTDRAEARRRLGIAQVLALITATCFGFTAVELINSGSQPWWVHTVLLFSVGCMGLFLIRTSTNLGTYT